MPGPSPKVTPYAPLRPRRRGQRDDLVLAAIRTKPIRTRASTIAELRE
jgi:hypothetical protein